MVAPRWLGLSLLCLLFACSSKHGTSGDANNGSGSDSGVTIDAPFPCGTFGQGCTGNDQCCSHICGAMSTCEANPTVCTMAGGSCQANTDCCSVSCVQGVCQNSCVSDNGACTSNGQCCGGNCSNHVCVPLNASCKSDGNSCTASTDCCSGLCNANHTCGPSSWCTQDGDACAHDDECCGGQCVMGSSGTLGTCTHPSPGSTNCSAGVDGTVCGGCGDCCSRLCEVYQPTGVKVCQPAEGCRVDGDLCHTNSDCCGAAGTGLPGDGNVTCLKVNPTDTTGICRNPVSCNPEGDVCHYQNYQTCGNSSARNDCCAAPGNSGVCKLDTLGVPRCYGLGTMCQMSGQTCSYSGDCCNGLPCVPNSQGQLVCGASQCQMMGQTCTNTADCCNGTTCVYQPGQTYGTCGGMTTTCAQDGQTCNDTTPCCTGAGMCYVTGTTTACPTGMNTGCSCFVPVF